MAGQYVSVWDGSRWISVRGEKGDAGNSISLKGSKPTVGDLPTTGVHPGDAWLVAGDLYVADDAGVFHNAGKIEGPAGPQGIQGLPGVAGPKGDAGAGATVKLGTVSSGPNAIITNTGPTASDAVLNFTLPEGKQGIQGVAGNDGITPAVSVAATALAAGATPTATKTGTSDAPVITFGIPAGATGPTGAAGKDGLAATFAVGTVTTLAPGQAATATNAGSASAAIITLGIPTGATGATGATGPAGLMGPAGAAASISIGAVTTVAAGSPATATNTGTSSAAVISLGIPQGSQGIQGVAGVDGKAATISVGTVSSGTTLSVSNSGTSSAAVLNFTLVKGDAGPAGPAGKDGSGVTITGTISGGTWPPTGTYVKGNMVLIGTPIPTGAPAGTKTGDGFVYDGAAWTNVGAIQGPIGPQGIQGPAGPQAVSTDAKNYSRLGTDSKIFTPTPTIPDPAVSNPLVDAAAAVVGVSLKYAREDHVHPLPTITALGAAAATHTHAAATDITGLSKVATSGKYTDLTDTPAAFTLPTASATVLGGVKIGTGLSIAAGVLAATATTPSDATTAAKGIVQLADAAAITAGTAKLIPDASQLKAAVDLLAPKANPAFTGNVTIPDGTAALPSLKFAGDVDTGIYLNSSNSLGLAAGGAKVLEVGIAGITATALTAAGLKYPTADGTKDQLLATDGAGTLVWHSPSGYTLPAATVTTLGGVKIADAAAVTLGTAGLMADASQLKKVADDHVKITGDTMTGHLVVSPVAGPALPDGSIVVKGDNTNAIIAAQRAGDTGQGGVLALSRSRGTMAALTDVQAGDQLGTISWRAYQEGAWRAGGFVRQLVHAPPQVGDKFVRSSFEVGAGSGVANEAQLFINGPGVGIQWASPTVPLEVGGNSILRGKLDVTGNITSTGTAHSFTAASIPRSAVAGIAETDLDTRYVNVTGDTMTGALTTTKLTARDIGASYIASQYSTQPIVFQSRVTSQHEISVTSTTPNPSGDSYGLYVDISGTAKTQSACVLRSSGTGAGLNTLLSLQHLPTATPVPDNTFAVLSLTQARSSFYGPVGLGGVVKATNPLEVAGASVLRGTLDVTGNITSTGTAHAFTAKSIPVTALSAFPTVPTSTPASQTAPGVAGQMEWDANYLYLAIAANQWRRIPLADWFGNSAPGAGAGATDTALPATFSPTALAEVSTTTPAGGPPIGKITMNLVSSTPAAFPALSTGIKVQYRIHGGNWVDAASLAFYAGSAIQATFNDWKAAASGVRKISVTGPTPGTPYITRMAWTSSLGTGLWSNEYTAVTPTA